MRDAQGGVVELGPEPAVNSISFDQARWSMQTWALSHLLLACTSCNQGDCKMVHDTLSAWSRRRLANRLIAL